MRLFPCGWNPRVEVRNCPRGLEGDEGIMSVDAKLIVIKGIIENIKAVCANLIGI